MHLFLTGLRGTGKSSLGRSLADQLGLPFIDLDDSIEAAANLSIREIFERQQESGFRAIETDCLLKAISGPPSIISLGGGAIMADVNRKRINESGKTIWLTGEPLLLAARIRADASTATRRPDLVRSVSLEDELIQLLNQRRTWYRDVADWEIDTTENSVAEITSRAVAWWNSLGDTNRAS